MIQVADLVIGPDRKPDYVVPGQGIIPAREVLRRFGQKIQGTGYGVSHQQHTDYDGDHNLRQHKNQAVHQETVPFSQDFIHIDIHAGQTEHPAVFF